VAAAVTRLSKEAGGAGSVRAASSVMSWLQSFRFFH
jgi:hypothetical protein